MRRCGTLAATSDCAVRSTIRSRNENFSERRGPRSGVTKPASTNARIVLFGNPSNFSVSCTPYRCIR
jgi:hypothetical protein